MATNLSALEAAMAPHLAPVLRNSQPDAPAAKKDVSVASLAARQAIDLQVMRRTLNPVADRELCTAIAAAEAALLQVQYAAGNRRVLVAA